MILWLEDNLFSEWNGIWGIKIRWTSIQVKDIWYQTNFQSFNSSWMFLVTRILNLEAILISIKLSEKFPQFWNPCTVLQVVWRVWPSFYKVIMTVSIFPLTTTKGELKYTRLLRDLCTPSGLGSGFQALGLNFPAFLHKPLSLKNVEHALCEYDK